MDSTTTFQRMFVPLLSLIWAFLPSLVALCCDDGNCSHRGFTTIPRYQDDCDQDLKLTLSWNSINRINSGDLKGYLHLRRLEISQNQLTSVEEGALVDALNLVTLDLSYNSITSSTRSFSGAPSLRDVYLQHNEIRVLDSNFFAGVPTIEYIDVSYNSIYEVNDTTFFHTHRIRTLKLSHNKITSISEQLFRFNNQLQKIDLSNNRITVFPSRLVENLNSLDELKLSSNLLTIITIVVNSEYVFLKADNCGLHDIPEIQFGETGEGVIEMDLRDNLLKCNCYTLVMKVGSNRTLRCIDDETGEYSFASCLSEQDVTTISRTVSMEMKQTTREIAGVQDEQTSNLRQTFTYITPIVVVMVVVGLVVAIIFYRRHRGRSRAQSYQGAAAADTTSSPV